MRSLFIGGGSDSSQKGFSLVELLIVIAIMGVLAVIAFNAFNGVLINSKIRADEQQANNLAKSLRILITDTGYSDVIDASANTRYKSASDGSADHDPITNDQTGVENLIKILQSEVFFLDDYTGVYRRFGPYLDSLSTGPAYELYRPQWSPESGGENNGYVFEINSVSNTVRGMPVKGAAGSPASGYIIDSSPGILVL
jgi:type IV pilus assembly protein PilA